MAPSADIKEELITVPFVEQVVPKVQKSSCQLFQQALATTEVTLNYQLDAGSVVKIYTDLRQEYEGRIIQPYIQEAVKSTTANYDAEELITQRPKVRDELQNLIAERLKPLGIDVVQLSITDFQFSPAFQDSIEAKVRAVQQALEAENALKRVEFEAQQEITRARAEAEGLRLQKQQITAQLLELRKIEVQRSAVEKWNGVMPSVVTSGGPVPMLDVFRARR